MDKKLDCEIVRDRLPSYVAGLTSGERNKVVEEHLAECSDCAEVLRNMKESAEQRTPLTIEVDDLKRTRHHIAYVGMVCGIVLMAVGILLLLSKVFQIF